MVYRKVFFTFLGLLTTYILQAQAAEVVNIGGPKYLVKTASLPENLTSSRSVVVIYIPEEKKDAYTNRGDWKKLAAVAHKNFRNIGLDAVWYLYEDDLSAGPEVEAAYQKLFSSRSIKNIVHIRQTGDVFNPSFSLKVVPLTDNGEVLHGQLSWMEQSSSLSTLVLRMGRQVLRQGLERTNFLIPEQPEYLTDLAVFTGNRLENFPSRLKSLTLAVAAFQKVSAVNVTNTEILQTIQQYNETVDQKNAELNAILSRYPFKFKLVDTFDNELLYQQGYQYVLFPLCSTGKTVKKILNYPTNETETDYIATVYNSDRKQELVQIPVNANICKYYIKQTIIKDIHTGKYWDTQTSWQESLENFILHLRSAFRLPMGG